MRYAEANKNILRAHFYCRAIIERAKERKRPQGASDTFYRELVDQS